MNIMKIRQEHLEKLQQQFCIDFNCNLEDLKKDKNIVTVWKKNDKRRWYVDYPLAIRAATYYDKILISVDERLYDWAKDMFLEKFSGFAFSYQNLKMIDQKLNSIGQELKDVHNYYLPIESYPQAEKKYCLKWFEKDDMEEFRGKDGFSEAIAFQEHCPDVLAVAAMNGDEIMGIAGASEDGHDLWQIGIDVKEEYRGKGLAVNLVQNLKDEIIRRGKVPFYGMVSSHNLSKSVAAKAGFFPVWTEIFGGPIKY